MTEQEIMNLIGDELDYAVAIANGLIKSKENDVWFIGNGRWIRNYHPSTNGTQCMELMEREKMAVRFTDYGLWFAKIDNDKLLVTAKGKTPNEAILRCFLLSKQ